MPMAPPFKKKSTGGSKKKCSMCGGAHDRADCPKCKDKKGVKKGGY